MSNIGTLYVQGRRTGIVRTVRLRYTITSQGFLLISAGDLSEQWPLNLRANPVCQFKTVGKPRPYHAVEQSLRRFRLDPM